MAKAPTSRQIGIKVDPATYAALSKIATREKRGIAFVVKELVADGLPRREAVSIATAAAAMTAKKGKAS